MQDGPPCRYIRDKGCDRRVLIPGCIGTTCHLGFMPDKEAMEFCTCWRRPRYKKGDKAKLDHLYARLELIQERIRRLEAKMESD